MGNLFYDEAPKKPRVPGAKVLYRMIGPSNWKGTIVSMENPPHELDMARTYVCKLEELHGPIANSGYTRAGETQNISGDYLEEIIDG